MIKDTQVGPRGASTSVSAVGFRYGGRVGDSGEERERVGDSGEERERVGKSGDERGRVGKKGREWGIVGERVASMNF